MKVPVTVLLFLAGLFPVHAWSVCSSPDLSSCVNDNRCMWVVDHCRTSLTPCSSYATLSICLANEGECYWGNNMCYPTPRCEYVTTDVKSDCTSYATLNHPNCIWIHPSSNSSCQPGYCGHNTQVGCNALYNSSACNWNTATSKCQRILDSQMTVLRQDPARFPVPIPSGVIAMGDVLSYWFFIYVFSRQLAAGGTVTVTFSGNGVPWATFVQSSVVAGSIFAFAINLTVPLLGGSTYTPPILQGAVQETDSGGVVLSSYSTNNLVLPAYP